MRASSRVVLVAFVPLAVLVAFGVSSLAPRRSCAAGDSSDSAKAEELIAKANQLRRQGQDERALPLVRQAYEISRTPRSAAQLGLAELAVGYWNDAREHLNEALTSVSHHPWVDKNRRTLQGSLETAMSHLASLTVFGTPDGAEVLLNNKTVGTIPLSEAVTVNEGRVEIEVRGPGLKPEARVMTLQGKSATRVTFNLQPVVAASAPRAKAASVARAAEPASEEDAPTARRQREVRMSPGDSADTAGGVPSWRRVLPWTLVVGAMVTGGLGIWQQLGSGQALDDFNAISGCGASAPMRGTDARCQGLYEDYSNGRTRAFIGYGAAGVLGGAAIGILIWNAVSAQPAGAPTVVVFADRPGDFQISCRVPF